MLSRRRENESGLTELERATREADFIQAQYIKELDRIHLESLQVWDASFEELTGKTPHWGTVQLGPQKKSVSFQLRPSDFYLGMQNQRADFQQLLHQQQLGNVYGGLNGLSQRGLGLGSLPTELLDRLTGREDS
jgi:hypothetical protein